MKRVDTIARVRRACYVQKWSMKKIVRELHVSRNTMRKILRMPDVTQTLNEWTGCSQRTKASSLSAPETG